MVRIQNEMCESTGEYTEVLQRDPTMNSEVIEDSALRVALGCCLCSEVSQVVLNPSLVL